MPRISSAAINRGSLRPLPSDNGDATSHGWKFSVTTKSAAEEEEPQTQPGDGPGNELRGELNAIRDEWADLQDLIARKALLAQQGGVVTEVEVIPAVSSFEDIIELGRNEFMTALMVTKFNDQAWASISTGSALSALISTSALTCHVLPNIGFPFNRAKRQGNDAFSKAVINPRKTAKITDNAGPKRR